MTKNLLNCNKTPLLEKVTKGHVFITRLLYPKIGVGRQTILSFGLILLVSFVVLAVALSSTGCKVKDQAQTAEKKVEKTEDLLGDMPDSTVAERRAKREAEFQEAAQDTYKSPIADPNETEKSSAEFGFGQKTDAQIEREKPRANRIGVLAPLVGDVEVFGKETMDGAEMASDEIEQKGGIKNQVYDLVVYDTKGSMDLAREGAKTFVNQNIAGIIGAPTGEVSFAATKIINENQLILISAGSRRRLGDTGPYNFRITLNDNYAIKRLMEYAVGERKFNKFAIFTSLVNDYSIKLSAAFKMEAEKQKVQISHELYLYSAEVANVQAEENSIPAQLKKLKKNVPDAIIYTGDGSEGAALIKEMKKLGLHIPLIGGEDLMVPEFYSLGEEAAGTLIYAGFNPNSDNQRIKKFVSNFRNKYKRDPSRVAALSYDAYYVLAKGIETAKSLRPYHIRESLMKTKNFPGITGITSFNENREAIKEPFLLELKRKDNKFTFVSIREPL